MRRRSSGALAVLIACSVARTTPTRPAFAQSSESPPQLSDTLRGPARADYEAGRERLAAGDFAGARARFARAYDVVADPRILANLALADKNLGHCARATTSFEKALTVGGGLFTPAQTRDVREMVRQCAGHVARAHLSVAPAGASIAIDDVPIRESPPTEDVLIDPGPHRVRVSKPGFREQVAEVNASGGRPLALHFVLEPAASNEVGPAPEGTLAVRTSRENAIALDGQVVGKGEWTSRVSAGAHRLTVSAEGSRTYAADIRVAAGQKRTLDVTLDPDRGASIWMWTAGGLVVVAGIVIAAAVVFRSPGPVSVPAAVTTGFR